MKISLVTETFLPQINGIVRTLEKIVLYLEKNGHEVQIIAVGDGEKKYSKSEVVRVPGVKFALYEDLSIVSPQEEWVKKVVGKVDVAQIPLSLIQSLVPMPHPVVEKAIEDFNPDIIHLANPATLGSIGYYYADKLEIPCLSTFHTDLSAYTKQYKMPYLEALVDAINKMIYNRTKRVLAPSESTKAQLEKIGIKNVGVFGRGVDTNLFNPKYKSNKHKTLEKYNLTSNKTTVLYAGRLAEEKSLPVLIQAFKKIHLEHNLQLLLVGDGPIKDAVSEELKGTPHALVGFKKGEDYAEIFGAADIFAFPSKTETFGQVVLEAMASGLPVIGFDAPGVRDLVKNNVSGFLAQDSESKENNVNEFSLKLEKLSQDQTLREKLGEAALNEAKKRSWDETLGGLIKEYQQAIQNQ